MNTFNIPSKQTIIAALQQQPMSLTALNKHFSIEDSETESFSDRVQKMHADQYIEKDENSVFHYNKTKEKTGVVNTHPRGFGFFVLDNEEEDWFINPNDMKDIFPGERMVAIPKTSSRGTEALLLRRDTLLSNVTGQMKKDGALTLFSVDGNKWLPATFLTQDGAPFDFAQREQSWLVVDGVHPPSSSRPHTFNVRTLLGPQKIFDPLRYHCLHDKGFEATPTNDVLEEAIHLCSTAPVSRRDEKAIPFISIDGPGSRDLDDLIFIEKTNVGHRIMVAIADVSTVVAHNSCVDRRANQAGTSVYTPGRSFPMLPPIIANEMCSLLPNAERSALVLEVDVDSNSEMLSHQFYEALVCSKHRFSYERVDRLLEHEPPTSSEKPFLTMLQTLSDFCEPRINEKDEQQTIPFARREFFPVFDADGDVVEFARSSSHRSQRYIEELMVLANSIAGKFLVKHLGYGLFRHHAGLDPEKLSLLNEWLISQEIAPLKTSSTMADCHLISQQLPDAERPYFEQRLRQSLLPAQYDQSNSSHFGLSLSYYAHFTSPIRRYADLVTHRLIKHCLHKEGEVVHGAVGYTPEALSELSTHLSDRAYQAMLVERNIMDGIACRWWQKNHIPGEPIPGMVAGKNKNFLFVQLAESPFQGALSLDTFDNDENVPSQGESIDVFIDEIDVDSRRIKLLYKE